MNTAGRSSSIPLRVVAIVLLAGGLYLLGNARVALWDRDEPRYAQTSRQMLQSGDWVVPHLMDQDRTVKPIFIYWCQAGAMKLFGDNAFAARFPSVVAMVLTLLVLWLAIARWIGPHRALWTVFIFATSGMVIAAAKMSITDAVLLLFITLSQLCLYAILRGRGTWGVVCVMGLSVGLAGLTKGPVVLGILATTLIALGLLDLLDRRHKGRPGGQDRLGFAGLRASDAKSAALKWVVAIVLVVAVLAPWLYAIERQRPGYTITTIKTEILHRSAKPMEGHKGPPGYYLLTIWGTYFPWSLLLLTALTVAWRHRRLPAIRFALAAVIGPWVMMEIVQTKLPHYLLPVYPFLAFLTADALIRCARRQHDDLVHRRFIVMTAVWAVIVVILGGAPWLASRVFRLNDAMLNAMTALSALSLAYALVVFRHVRARRIYAAATSMGLGMIVIIAVLYGWYLPHADFLRLSPNVAAVLKQQGATHPGDVESIGYREPSLVFHQGGTLRPQREDLYLTTHDPAEWPKWLVIRDDIWAKMPPSVVERFDVINSFRGIAYADDSRPIEVFILRKRDRR